MDTDVTEAGPKLAELLDRVAEGEEVVITRRGRPAARLVAVKAVQDREAAHRALDEIRELMRGTSLGGLSIRDLMNEGRA